MFARKSNRSRHRTAQRARFRSRCRFLESLESRILLATAEGTPFAISEVLDTSDLTGNISASIDWGDGASTTGEVVIGGGGSLVGRVDYSLDTNNFFDTQLKKDLFQQAVDTILSKLGDELDTITPSDGNSWSAEFAHPGTGAATSIEDLPVAANEIVIFAGGRELGSTLGVGGPGGFSVSCIAAVFCDSVATRGQVGASVASPTDFGLWGGVVAFDTTTNFHFSQSLVGLTDTQKSDFLSVAQHEVAHLLGFGTSQAWQTYVSSNQFIGPASRVANGNQSVPLSPGGGHWANGTMSGSVEAALDPSLTNGTRKLLTPLDYAGLDDIGWELITTSATVTGSHSYGDDGVYDISLLLEGSTSGTATRTIQETITNSPPVLDVTTLESVAAGLPFTIVDIGMFSDAGFGISESFTYEINWGDGTASDTGVASIDRVGSAGVTTLGSFDGTHQYTAGGTYDVTVTVVDDDGGEDSNSFELLAGLALSVDIDADVVTENDGQNATTLTVSRGNIDVSSPLLVSLATDESELAIPTTVEIPAGESSVIVQVGAVDDDLLDGTQGVTVVASATGFLSASDSVIVADYETISLKFADDTVSENAGELATTLTVTRGNNDLDSSLLVFLNNSPDSAAAIPASVTIPYGESSATIDVAVVDNDILGANQTTTISATANGYFGGSASLVVTDYETLTLAVNTAVILETDGQMAATVTITRSNSNIDESLTVAISGDNTEVTVPATVTIPAGEAYTTFAIDAFDDGVADGTQTVQISAAATGYEVINATLQVAEAYSWHNSNLRWDTNNDGSVSPIDALVIINELNANGSQMLSPPTSGDIPAFYDVNNDSFISPLDVLVVINFINAGGAAPEGESASESPVARGSAKTESTSTALLATHDTIDSRRAQTGRITSKREIVLFTDEFVDSLRDDFVSDIVASLDRVT